MTEDKNPIPISAAVIGLGAIGMEYDLSRPELITTHARAYSIHPGFSLVAGVDTSSAARSDFKEYYGAQTFSDIEEMLEQTQPQLVSVCVPTELHLPLMEILLSYGVRNILCEKPLAMSEAGANRLNALIAKHKARVAVNYMRRFLPECEKIKALFSETSTPLSSENFGRVESGVIWYTGGVINSASHFIDLMLWFFGPASSIRLLNYYSSEQDPRCDFQVLWPDKTLVFLSHINQEYSRNEFELTATGGGVRYLESGGVIELRHVIEHPSFSGVRCLNSKPRYIESHLDRYQYHVLEQIKEHWDSGAETVSNQHTATVSLELISSLLKQIVEAKK